VWENQIAFRPTPLTTGIKHAVNMTVKMVWDAHEQSGALCPKTGPRMCAFGHRKSPFLILVNRSAFRRRRRN
jgi:hypothetical protein